MKSVVCLSVMIGSCLLIGARADLNTANYSKDQSVYFSSDTSLRNAADTAAANFVAKASMGGLKEVEMGKQAQERASNPRVKAFAAMMVRDHTKANAELTQLAAVNKMTVPTKSQHKEHKLPAAKGKGFDQEYMTMMVKDHQKTIGLFERASANVKNAGLKAFADKTLPVLRAHLDSAKAIYGALKPWNQ
jgi:putative membrane protein